MLCCELSADPSEQWFFSSDSYLRSVRHPQLCVVPSKPYDLASDRASKTVSLSACPAAPAVDDKSAWRFDDGSTPANVASG
jgi:hypothetical protein